MLTGEHKIIQGIYDAALDASIWGTVLDDITDFFSGSVGVLMCHDHVFPLNDIHVHVNNPRELQQLYMEEYFLQGDIWYQIAKRHWPEQSVIIGNDHISDSDLRKTGFYQDILAPADGGQQLSGSIRASKKQTRALAISRPFSARRFQTEDKQIMQTLIEHLDRAFTIHEKMNTETQGKALLGRFLSMTNVAALICNEKGKAIYLNELAESLLGSGKGLRLQNDKIHSDAAKDNEAMEDFIKRVNRTGSAVHILDSGNSGRTYQLLGFHIDADKHALENSGRLIGVFINDPAANLVPDRDILMALYRLTSAEAEIIQFLFTGLSPAEIAREKNIKISTVRTHLHRIFDKTETGSQAELIRVVVQSIARYRQSGGVS